MKEKSFRYCMFVGALALAGVATYYFFNFLGVHYALKNNGLQDSLRLPIEGLWLAFASQGLLISLLYVLVAYRPHAVSREVIVILGLLHLVEAVLLFSFSGSTFVAALLIIAAAFVLLGALLWPQKLAKTSGNSGAPHPV